MFKLINIKEGTISTVTCFIQHAEYVENRACQNDDFFDAGTDHQDSRTMFRSSVSLQKTLL